MYKVEKIERRNGYRTVTVTFIGEDGEEEVQRTWEVGDGISVEDLVAEYCDNKGIVADLFAEDGEHIELSNGVILDWVDVLRERAEEEAEDTADELDEA